MARKITCPTCGNTGDQNGDDAAPAFAIRGQYAGRAVRKCLSCGSGLLIGVLSGSWIGKPEVIPRDLWMQMEAVWRGRH